MATGQRRRSRERDPRGDGQANPSGLAHARRPEVLRRAIHALDDYGHVSVQTTRGHLTICIDEGTPVVRATPLGAGHCGLSFHTHTGRWEPMPGVADLTHLARDLVGLLGPYLQRWDFPDRNSGSDH